MLALLDKIKEANITKEEALVIIDKLKLAIENKDDTYISSICERINPNSDNPCVDLFSMSEVCTNVSLEYKTSPQDETNFTLLTGLFDSCTKAYIYVDEDFTGFLDRDIDYLSSKGVKEVEIIVTITGEKIYSGNLKEEIDHEINKEKREGWFILLCVLIFIGMGLLLKRYLR